MVQVVLSVQEAPAGHSVLLILLNHLNQTVLMDLVGHLVPAAQLDLEILMVQMVL